MVKTTIAERITDIRERIAAAADRYGRNADEITLVAVSKTHPLDLVVEAARTGLVSHFGENRVQEGEEKIPHFPSDLDVTWHLIGHLQRNKARKAVELFDAIESVDSLKIARRLENIASEFEVIKPVLMEVNCAGEESKTGLAVKDAPELVDFIRDECPHLLLKGLMTIGPLGGNESEVRRVFATARNLRESFRKSPEDLPVLSMGMSGDFEWAIAEGSTQVRVGTAIFGHR